MRRIALVVLALCVGGLACSDDDADTSSFCEDREDLQASIEDLREVNVLEDGIEDLDSKLDTVLQDVETLRVTAGELEPEVDTVRSSAEALEASVASASTPVDKATALVDGLSDLSVAWDSLDEAAGSECD